MAPSRPERNASSSSDEEENHELHDQDGDPAQQEDDPPPSVSLPAKENEKRVDVNFCIGADEPELHKVSFDWRVCTHAGISCLSPLVPCCL